MKFKTSKITHTICMIYFGSFFAGIINGLFASGAGQILVFILIFILKQDTYSSRKLSVFVIGVTSILTLVRYVRTVKTSLINVLIVGITGFILGKTGTKIMKKIDENILNICSGLLIAVLAIFKLIRS